MAIITRLTIMNASITVLCGTPIVLVGFAWVFNYQGTVFQWNTNPEPKSSQSMVFANRMVRYTTYLDTVVLDEGELQYLKRFDEKPPWKIATYRTEPKHQAQNKLGFRPFVVKRGRLCKHVFISLYYPTLFAGALLLLIIRRTLRQDQQKRRLEKGQCIRCGYDLRGSFDRCPECGASYEARSTVLSNSRE